MRDYSDDDSVSVELKTDGFPVPTHVRVGARNGFVLLSLNFKTPRFWRTPLAHRTGFDLVKLAGQCQAGELVSLTINGTELHFEPQGAKRIGASLLRRADAADDFQIKRVS